MTIGNHDMTNPEQDDFMDALERINRAGTCLRLIAWGLSVLAIAGLAVAGWVWTVNGTQLDHTNDLHDLKPRLSHLETWKTKVEASPTPTVSQLHDLDKRLDRTETRLLSIYEQNALILETLKAIERRP